MKLLSYADKQKARRKREAERRKPRASIARKSKPNRVNRARKAREFARTYGSKERVEFVKSLPCAICGVRGYSENAHVGGVEGMGRKGSYLTIAPLCGAQPYEIGCHYWQGRSETFRDANAAKLAHAALDTEARWQRHQEGR